MTATPAGYRFADEGGDALEAPCGPLPPEHLMWRVAGTPDADHFAASGRQSVADVERALAVFDTSLASARKILDFGCGSGRILRWLGDLQGVAVHGCDIDEEATAWVRANLPYVDVETSGELPPLPYADDAFDVVFSHSVFTHLPEDYQDVWLAELGRVVRPDGLVVLSTSGEHAFEAFRASLIGAGADPGEWDRLYREKGFVYVADDSWQDGPFPDFYHSTFHSPPYVFEHWSRLARVRAYIARGALDYQDVVVLSPRE